jgi:hypothetical protein
MTENKIDKGCYDCSHRRFCHMLEEVKENNTMHEDFSVSHFFVSCETIGTTCQQNDRRLRV